MKNAPVASVYTLLLLTVACGGGGPTHGTGVATPTPVPGVPAGTAIIFLAGDTERPVAGAEVAVGGLAMRTDAEGRIILSAATPLGAPIDVLAPGYRDRRTTLALPVERPYTLWPTSAPTGLTDLLTTELVYTTATGGTGLSADLGAKPLERIAPSITHMFIQVDTDSIGFKEDDWGATKMDTAVAGMNELLEGRVLFQWGHSAPAGANVIQLLQNQTMPAGVSCSAAPTARDALGYTTAGRISCRGNIFDHRAGADPFARDSAPAILHELGHIAGLGHSTAPIGVMSYFPRANNGLRAFTPSEISVGRLMYQRRARNRSPDDDRDVGGPRMSSQPQSEWMCAWPEMP